MADELAGLPEGVRQARTDLYAHGYTHPHMQTAIGKVDAELLRLARLVDFHQHQVGRIRKMLGRPFSNHNDARIEWDVNDAVQEVGTLRDACEAYDDDVKAYRDRAERAEAELAAIKREIAEAGKGIVTQLVKHLGPGGPDQVTIDAHTAPFDALALGQRVALLPVGGE